jgi:Cu(I)/Ag(I) efflux system membrane fusion protein
MQWLRRGLWLVLSLAVASLAQAADLRQRMRDMQGPPTVSEAQATELTLTYTTVEVRPIQDWVRTAAVLAGDGQTLAARLPAATAGRISAGQRARAFPVESRSSMYQARITRVSSAADGLRIQAQLSGVAHERRAEYVLEIVVDVGQYLSIPNEAILEEDGAQVVYVSDGGGGFEQRHIEAGIQGERYTQVLKGLQAGEQVVTTGSFFVDAEYRMKGG